MAYGMALRAPAAAMAPTAMPMPPILRSIERRLRLTFCSTVMLRWRLAVRWACLVRLAGVTVAAAGAVSAARAGAVWAGGVAGAA